MTWGRVVCIIAEKQGMGYNASPYSPSPSPRFFIGEESLGMGHFDDDEDGVNNNMEDVRMQSLLTDKRAVLFCRRRIPPPLVVHTPTLTLCQE